MIKMKAAEPLVPKGAGSQGLLKGCKYSGL